MNYEKLYNAIDNRNMKVTELLSEMQAFGVKMSRSAFYRKMNGSSEFDRKEIEAIEQKIIEVVGPSVKEPKDKDYCSRKNIKKLKLDIF